MRPRNRLPFANSIVEAISPASSRSSACGSHGTADAMWPCVGEKPGSPCSCAKPGIASFVELAAHHREARQHPVVAVGDVAAAGRLRDLRVVELRRVARDVRDPAAELLERPHDDVRQERLLGRARADPVAPDRVEADHRGRVVGRPDEDGHAGEHVLEHGHAVVERAGELHAELGERPAGHDDDPLVRPRLDERSSHDQGVHRRRAERLHVAAARVTSPPPSAIALRERAAAALVAVAHRLLAATDRVVDPLRLEIDALAEQPKSLDAARLAAEVLEQHGGLERLVEVVGRGKRAHDPIAFVEADLARFSVGLGAERAPGRTGRAPRAARSTRPAA